MKRKITFLSAAFMLLAFLAVPLGMRGQTRAEEVYSTCLFGPNYNSTGVSSYTSTFTATNGDFSWIIANGNNNNNQWNYVKFGRKNNASVGSITTTVNYGQAITKVDLTIDAITADKVNSITLYTSSDNNTWVEASSFGKATGVQTATLATPATGLYYKIELDCASGSANGLVTVSKVEYYYNSDGPSTPTITASNIELAYGATEGAIAYTINNPVDNGSIAASTESEWLYVDEEAQNTSEGSFDLLCDPNTGDARMATVTLTYTYGEESITKDVTVTQAAAPVVYTTIPDLFAAATSTETNVLVNFNSWVVSGVSTNGKNVFVTDNEGNGFVIFNSNAGLDDIYTAGDILSGEISCTLKLYNGFAELLNVNAEDLTITEGGSITEATVAMADLTGVNTGALLHYENLTCSVNNNKYYLTDGTTTLQVYNSLFAFEALENGETYNITGIYQQYNNTKEILPRSAEDIVMVVISEPSITMAEYNYNVEATSGDGIITVVYENFTTLDPHVQLYDADGAEVEPEYYQEWISVFIGYEDDYVHYGYEANTTTEDRTVYFKVYNGEVYSELATITQAGIVAPEPPTAGWVLTNLADLTEDDVFVIVGTDDDNDDTFALPNNATTAAPAATSITVADGLLTEEPAEELQWHISGNATDGYTFYPNGDAESWLYCNNTNNGVRVGTNENNTFKMDEDGYMVNDATSRVLSIYVNSGTPQDWRCYSNYNNNPVAISFYKKVGEPLPPTASITVDLDYIEVTATGEDDYVGINYENLEIAQASDFGIQFYDALGEELDDEPDWMTAEVITQPEEDGYFVYYVIEDNNGEARTAYFKVFAMNDEDFVYSNLVTVTQEEYVAPVASITFDPDSLIFDSELHYDGTMPFTYENIIVESMQSFGLQFYTAEGEETGMPEWFFAMVTPRSNENNGEYQVSCAIMANEGEARSVYFKVYAFDADSIPVYSNLATVTQTAPVFDYAVLPFVWEGGSSADFLALNGVTANDLGNDYASGNAPYLIKFDGTGDYIQVKTDSQPGMVTINVKMIGGSNTSTITIQGSADGVTFTDIETLTISGSQNDELTLETTNAFGANDRYVRMLFTKGSNVGVGPITITKGTVPSITLTPDIFELEAVGPLNGMHLPSMMVYCHNLEIAQASDFNYQFYNAEGEEQEMPEWILHSEVSLITETGYQAICIVTANEGPARSAYFKVYAYDADSNPVYSNLVTINQAAYEAPAETWVLTDLADLTEGDVFAIVGTRYDDNYAGNYAMPNDNGTSSAPAAVAIDVVNGTLSEAPAANLQWNLSRQGNSYTFYPNGDAENWLYCTNTNNGVRVGGTNVNNAFVLDESGYLMHVFTSRYIGIYNSQDWRCYTNTTGNIAGQTFAFYKKIVPTETYTLNVNGYGESETNGYVLLASPVYVKTETTGMTTGEFDLYYFDQSEVGYEWRNFEVEEGQFNLVPGKGYLYAHNTDVELTFTGIPYSGDGTITLVKDDNAVWAGWNLVGNPFGTTAYLDRDFYVMNEAGTEILTDACTGAVEAMQGVFVIAEEDGEPLTFTTEAPEAAANVTLNLSQNRGAVIDRAIVRFGEGRQLPKFQLNTESTKLYIPQGNNDYAVVRSAAYGEMPVNFKAQNNGSYTISVNAENADANYLHLIDNMTGNDIDLLATPSYSFEAKTTDYASRFRLVFNITGVEENTNSTEPFAFFNGSEWVISNIGKATLQMVDLTGRILSSESISGNATVSTANLSTGIYLMRLVNGEKVKTQKIVVK